MTSSDQAAPPVTHPAALRWALLVVLPYVLLAFVWAVTNPPDGSPDEHDHLIKALAAARLDMGVPYAGQPYDDSPGAIRNASITRTVTIPLRLYPAGFDCLAFHPDRTADCLPTSGPGEGTTLANTTVGAYPVFGYIPIGLIAQLAQTPNQAFLFGRFVSILMSSAFLLVAAWQLIRWLGRGALLGLAVAVTPMALFAAASVSTSGLEIMTAVAVGSVAVIATRRPEALADRGTLAVLAVSAVSLLLSRQLGVASLALAAAVALSRGGAPVVWRQLRAGRPAIIVTIGVVALAAVTIFWWERSFDNPTLTGSITSSFFSATNFGDFANRGLDTIRSAIGWFGWVDTPLPGAVIALWILLAVSIIGAAAIFGARADAITLVLGSSMCAWSDTSCRGPCSAPSAAGSRVGICFRFSLLPILAGVVLHEKVSVAGGRRRLFGFVAVVVGAVQVFSVMVNGRRYAVGVDGPAVFLAEAHWAPRGGWLLWLLIALAAGLWLAVVIFRSGRPRAPTTGIDGEPVGSPDSAETATLQSTAQPTAQLTLLTARPTGNRSSISGSGVRRRSAPQGQLLTGLRQHHEDQPADHGEDADPGQRGDLLVQHHDARADHDQQTERVERIRHTERHPGQGRQPGQRGDAEHRETAEHPGR